MGLEMQNSLFIPSRQIIQAIRKRKCKAVPMTAHNAVFLQSTTTMVWPSNHSNVYTTLKICRNNDAVFLVLLATNLRRRIYVVQRRIRNY